MDIDFSTAKTDALNHFHKIYQASGISSLLSWDQEVTMPTGAVEMRAGQSSYLQSHIHGLETAPVYRDSLEKVLSQQNLADRERRIFQRLLKKSLRSSRVPTRLIEAIASHSVRSYKAWKDAQKNNNFQIFAPHLSTMIDLKKEFASAIAEPGQSPYEALLDEYETDFPVAQIRALFLDLKHKLVPMVAEIIDSSSQRPSSMATHHHGTLLSLNLEEQKRLSIELAKTMCFDLDSGRIDEAAHPFCSGTWKDVRLTTRYLVDDLTNSMFSILHEAGHGLYEQGIGQAFGVHPLADVPSFGMHESQSRFWENMIGRSQEFSEFIVPFFQQNFPVDQRLTSSTFYSHVNTPKYSYIRVDADEATYNLHILLRFEIEEGLFSGQITTDTLVDEWNDRVKKYLFLPAPSVADGVLQDVHWSWGAFGYFPSYALGNLIAAQLADKVNTEIKIDQLVRRGEFGDIRNWLYDKVYSRGAETSTLNLVHSITGNELSTEPFLSHLRRKFLTT